MNNALTINISDQDWQAVGPALILAGTILLVMLADLLPAVKRGALAGLALLGVAAAIVYTIVVLPLNLPQGAFGGMVRADDFAFYLSITVLVGGGLALLVSADYIPRTNLARPGEYYALMLSAVLGMVLLATAQHFMTAFLGLELLSLALYILAGFAAGRGISREAGLKYFMLSSFATAFLLYGIALLYGATGKTGFPDIGAALTVGSHLRGGATLLLVGAGLVAAGLGFKVSAVPFHMWTPDVYEGSPAPVSLLMSIGTKTAAFAAMISVFNGALASIASSWLPVLWSMAVLTMIGGNLLALAQTNLKRLLAYSSVAHAGYILVGVVANSRAGVTAAIYYLAAYTMMNAGAFAAAAALERADGSGTDLAGLRGLAARRPGVAASLAICLLSLTGIPPLVGFFGKLTIFSAAFQSGHAELAIIGVLMSAVSAFYYLRILAALYQPSFTPPQLTASADGGSVLPEETTSLPLATALLLTGLGTVGMGIFVSPLLDAATQAARALFP
jgi:NADH-quinone oxidoreductase subunit N